MPILRPRLSRTEAREYGRCLRELRAEGIDVNCPDDSLEDVPALDITVVGGLASLIFNLPSGRAGYAIWLRLVARRSGLILLEQCEVTTGFDDQIELECFDLGRPICQLGQCKHHKSEVLNDRFPLRFHRRGDLIEGVILAPGLKPIPQEYVHGMVVPFKLIFWDRLQRSCSLWSWAGERYSGSDAGSGYHFTEVRRPDRAPPKAAAVPAGGLESETGPRLTGFSHTGGSGAYNAGEFLSDSVRDGGGFLP